MFTPEFITQVAGYGVAVLGVVEMVKRFLKVKGWIAVVISVVASFAVCLPSLSGDVLHWLLLVGCVILEANGLFKALHAPS